MTQPHIPLAPTTAPGILQPTAHPDLSRVLTHFCGRPRDPGADVPADITAMTPPDRLENILWDQRLRMFVTYSGGDPAVCFSELTEAGLRYMIQTRGYAPWGLMFDRESVYNAGGGPVWHVRTDQHEQLKKLAPQLRSWAVRLGEGSDWLEEREWRITRPKSAGYAPSVGLDELRLLGLLVGDPWWSGGRAATLVPRGGSQPQPGSYFPPALHPGLPRILWNPEIGHLDLAPLF